MGALGFSKLADYYTYQRKALNIHRLWRCISAWGTIERSQSGYKVAENLKAVRTRADSSELSGTMFFLRLALSTFNKEVNGVKMEITKPIIKLRSFHLCGLKPSSIEETQSEPSEASVSKKAKLSAVKS